MTPEPPATGDIRVTAWLTGRVQGVGMRWWVRARALELGLSGHAANLADGRVEIVLEGPAPACARLLELLEPTVEPRPDSALGSLTGPGGRPRPGRISGLTHRQSEPRGLPAGFVER